MVKLIIEDFVMPQLCIYYR